MTEIDPQYIKRGLWTNHDKGPVIGKTITVDSRTGSLVVALLAVLSTIGTAHAWHIVTFLIHQTRANGRPSDALFRQQQALLRTMPPPSTVVADTIKLWWSWRKNASCKRPLLRSLILVFVAVLFTVGTIAASIFSSLVVSSGNAEVLVNSPYCGWVTDRQMRPHEVSYRDPVLAVSIPYAEDCYKNGTRSRICENFARPNIAFTTQQTPCPFESMCKSGYAISHDSDLVDVNQLFGFNLPGSSQVKFRKKSTCQILPTDGYHTTTNGTYNKDIWLTYGSIFKLVSGNDTFSISKSNGGIRKGYIQRTFVNYTASPNGPVSPFNTTFFAVIPELQRNDGDIRVNIVEFNGISYAKPVEDPLFQAHKKLLKRELGADLTISLEEPYKPDFPAGVIGCLDQYQFCHARASKDLFCTEFMGLFSEVSQDVLPEATELQLAVLRLIMNSNYMFGKPLIRKNGESEMFLAESIEPKDGESYRELPDDQWEKELVWTESKLWAALQISMADYAIGPTVRDKKIASTEFVPPATDGEKQLCGMLKMRHSGDVVNINYFALIFIITASVLFMIIDLCVLKFLIYLSKVRKALGPRAERWIQDGIWQLQRRAFESQGHRNWSNIERDVPMTADQKPFLDLPILWLPDKNAPSDAGSPLSMSSFMRAQWELAQQPAARSKWSVRSLGKWFRRRKTVNEIGTPQHIH